ncbi:hypothetical protein AALP_AA1G303500 [Arabis alpina]|uniref:mRNA cap-binding protein n=1 Tax=Arabis alpina TaxID=50452 RepID=A0A087HRN8_ARAAL|nr:hypothetical protein AALP_AA1G303500 [Arabis alpina]
MFLCPLLALVGEQFEQGDEIYGVVLNFRARGDKISLWTKNAANEEAQTIEFIVHEDAKTLDRDAKRRYYV